MTLPSDELKDLLEKATPGPWSLCAHLSNPEVDEGCGCGYRGVVFGPEHAGYAVCQPGHEPAPEGQEGTEPPRYPRETERNNARLIAAAPDLAAEVIRLREALEEMRIAKLNAFNDGRSACLDLLFPNNCRERFDICAIPNPFANPVTPPRRPQPQGV